MFAAAVYQGCLGGTGGYSAKSFLELLETRRIYCTWLHGYKRFRFLNQGVCGIRTPSELQFSIYERFFGKDGVVSYFPSAGGWVVLARSQTAGLKVSCGRLVGIPYSAIEAVVERRLYEVLDICARPLGIYG